MDIYKLHSKEKKLKRYSDYELYLLVGDKVKDSELAFSILYDRHSPKLWAYCSRMTNDEALAKDVLQETFIYFYNNIESDSIIANIPTRLMTIAREIYKKLSRKKLNYVSFEEEVHSIQREEDNTELLDLIKKAMNKLPPDYKEIFILREYDCMSYLEICEITGESLSNVKVRIFRARAKVRELLESYIKEMKEMKVDQF